MTINFNQLYPWFDKKAEKFNQLGYPEITAENIEQYFKVFYWKHRQPDFYYQQVYEILQLNINQYFDFATLDAQVYSVKPLDEMDLSSLL